MATDKLFEAGLPTGINGAYPNPYQGYGVVIGAKPLIVHWLASGAVCPVSMDYLEVVG